jgi:hypothetical protein
MRGVIGVLALLLGPHAAMAQERASDPVSAAMAALNVVLPREAEQELALSAAPLHLRADASVYVFGARGFERVRSGRNGFSCLVNRDAFFYGASAFKPTCWDAAGEDTYLPVMLKVGELLASGASHETIARAIDTGFAAGTFRRPSGGGVAYMLAGDVVLDPQTGRVTRQLYPGHYMFYAAGATSAQLGYSADGARSDATLPFVFSGGAGGAHGLSYIIAVRHSP